MSNSVRHVLGALVGVVAIPIVLFGVNTFVRWVYSANVTLRFTPEAGAGVAAILVVCLLLGALAGSRISPLAALIPGVLFTLLGIAASIPDVFGLLGPLASVEYFSLGSIPYLLLGGILLGSAVFPNRWRPAQAARAAAYPQGPAPYAPAPGYPPGAYGPGGPQAPSGPQNPYFAPSGPEQPGPAAPAQPPHYGGLATPADPPESDR